MLHWYKSNYSESLGEFINGYDRFFKKYISKVQVCTSWFKLVIKEHVRNHSDFFLCFLLSTLFTLKKLQNSWNFYIKNTMRLVLNSKHLPLSILAYFVVSNCMFDVFCLMSPPCCVSSAKCKFKSCCPSPCKDRKQMTRSTMPSNSKNSGDVHYC